MRRTQALLVFFTGVNMVNYIDRNVLAAVLEPLRRDLRLSDPQLGALPFAFLAVYMASAPVFGALSERASRTRLVAFGVALWSLATAASAFAQNFPQLLATRALVGVGEASYAALGPAILSDIYPEDQRAAKFTWFYLAIPVGSALGYALGGLVAGSWGWRASFLVAGLPGLLLAGAMLRQPDPPRGATDVTRDDAAAIPYLRRLGLLFRNRIWVACTLSYVGYTFAMGALSYWAPALLQRKYGVSTAEAGMVFGGLAVATGIVGTFAGGIATDRLQRRFPDAGVLLSGATLLAALPVVAWALRTDALALAYTAFFVAMLLLFVNTSPVNALTVSCVPASLRASGAALNVLLIHLFGDLVSPFLVGVGSQRLGNSGDALAGGMMITLPAIALAGIALWWARGRAALAGPRVSTAD